MQDSGLPFLDVCAATEHLGSPVTNRLNTVSRTCAIPTSMDEGCAWIAVRACMICLLCVGQRLDGAAGRLHRPQPTPRFLRCRSPRRAVRSWWARRRERSSRRCRSPIACVLGAPRFLDQVVSLTRPPRRDDGEVRCTSLLSSIASRSNGSGAQHSCADQPAASPGSLRRTPPPAHASPTAPPTRRSSPPCTPGSTRKTTTTTCPAWAWGTSGRAHPHADGDTDRHFNGVIYVGLDLPVAWIIGV